MKQNEKNDEISLSFFVKMDFGKMSKKFKKDNIVIKKMKYLPVKASVSSLASISISSFSELEISAFPTYNKYT